MNSCVVRILCVGGGDGLWNKKKSFLDLNSVNISYILNIDKEKVHQWTTLSTINVAPQNTLYNKFIYGQICWSHIKISKILENLRVNKLACSQ